LILDSIIQIISDSIIKKFYNITLDRNSLKLEVQACICLKEKQRIQDGENVKKSGTGVQPARPLLRFHVGHAMTSDSDPIQSDPIEIRKTSYPLVEVPNPQETKEDFSFTKLNCKRG
jgi:hypothetical protein